MSNGFDGPIRVFLGTEPKTEIARKVMEVSILRRTDAEVRFTPMIGPAWEYPLDGITVGTGFSLRRWMIPAACNWQGRAIYCDADQIALDDIVKLWTVADAPREGPAPTVWCTYDNDKYNPKVPAPQTSVMVIDCAKAKGQWTFEIAKILAWLKAHPTREQYAELMHADFVDGVAQIDRRWNRLNAFVEGNTGILHYTKEDEQPWYKPDHPLAFLWRMELTQAIARGAVTESEIRDALANFGKKEDWRKSNGLHPDYGSFLAAFERPRGAGKVAAAKLRPKKTTPASVVSDRRQRMTRMGRMETAQRPDVDRAGAPKLLWMTSCTAAKWPTLGLDFVNAFLQSKSEGRLLVAVEGASPPSPDPSVEIVDLAKDAWLKGWLKANAAWIPERLGGAAAEPLCLCPDGPLVADDVRHRLRCLGARVNGEHSRWVRKVATLRLGLERAQARGYDKLVWLDAGCRFRGRVVDRFVRSWMFVDKAAFFLRGDRPSTDSVAVGYNLAHDGRKVAERLIERYATGRYRSDGYWDDGYQLQRTIKELALPVVDLAQKVSQNGDLLAGSPLGAFLDRSGGWHS